MPSTVQIIPSLAVSVTGLTATDVDDDPPASTANMIALPAPKAQAPIAVELVIFGDGSTERTLTGAYWFGWHAVHDQAVLLGPVADGRDLYLKSTKGAREVLELVAGLYTHVGIGKGTLSGGSIDLHCCPVELGE